MVLPQIPTSSIFEFLSDLFFFVTWETIGEKKAVERCSLCYEDTLVLPAGLYQLKVNYRNTRTRYEICTKLTVKITVTLKMFHTLF